MSIFYLLPTLLQLLKFKTLPAVYAVDTEIRDIQCRDSRDSDGFGQSYERDICPIRIDIGVLAQ